MAAICCCYCCVFMVSVHLFHREQDKEKYFSETWNKRVSRCFFFFLFFSQTDFRLQSVIFSALALSSQLLFFPPCLFGNLKADRETAKTQPFLHPSPSENPLFQIEICISRIIHINSAQVMHKKVQLDRAWLETNIQSKDGAQAWKHLQVNVPLTGTVLFPTIKIKYSFMLRLETVPKTT